MNIKKMKSQNIKYILFDLDGTLATFPINYNAIRENLKKYFEKYNKKSEFRPLIQEIRKLSKEIAKGEKNSSKKNIEIIRESFKIIDKFEVDSIKKTVPKSNVIALYKECINNNIKCAIITRNGRKMTIKFLKKYKLAKPHIICSRDECENLKPHPDQFEYIKKVLKGNNKNYLIIGDSWHDQALAKKMKIKFIHAEKLTNQ